MLLKKWKQLNITKKIVIIFITISFVSVFILGSLNSKSPVTQEENQDVEVQESTETKDSDKKESEEKTQEKETEKKKTEQKETKKETKTEEKKETKTTNIKKEEKTETKQESKKETKTEKKETKKDSVNKKENAKTDKSDKTKETNKNTDTNNESTTQKDTKQETVQEEKITVDLTITGVHKTMYHKKVKVKKETNAYTLLKQTGQSVKTSGFSSMLYVKSINGLSEKDYGPSSGWMYKVNGVAPNHGANAHPLKDGDTVVWYYVNYE